MTYIPKTTSTEIVATAASQLIYTPNHPNPGPREFTDFGDLYAAFQNTPGLVDIYFDYQHADFGVEPTVPPDLPTFFLPPATYNFDHRAEFAGTIARGPLPVVVVPQAGTIIEGLVGLRDACVLYNTTPDPIINLGEYGPFMPEIFFLENSGILGSAPGAAPVVTLGNGPSGQSVLAISIGEVRNFGAPAVGVAVGGFGIIALYNASVVEADSILGDATAGLFALNRAAATEVDLTNQANFLGAIIIQLEQAAEQLLYVPDAAGDWGASVPGNVADALDTLASNTTIP